MARKARLTGPWGKTTTRLKSLEPTIKYNLGKALNSIAKDLVRKIKAKIVEGDITWKTLSGVTINRKESSHPLLDTGALMNSIGYERVSQLHYNVGVDKRVPGKYGVPINMVAIVQEFGKVIKPKKASNLVIPLTLEAEQLANEYGISNIPDLFKIPNTKVLARKNGKEVEPMFVMVRSVVIPPRSFISSVWNHNKHKIRDKLYYAQKVGLKGKKYNPLHSK